MTVGFPEEAFVFYEGLEADNTKAYWTDHRPVYEQAVKAPMVALLDALEPAFGPAKLFRPYRDVRFSKDKTPYKTAAAAAFGDGLYLQLSADGLLVAGGAYSLRTDQARRLRAAAADDRPGRALGGLLTRLEADGLTVSGERLKRLPTEFEVDHPRVDLLTLKTLFASRSHEPADWMHGAELLDRVAAECRALLPLTAWLAEHVGPTRTEVQR